jgi:aryl-alcohol dehydrogenase-like predicted oxidoreductase
MEYRTLGRTGLKVSVLGLGAGGPSRLGQRDGINSEAESAAILQRGFDAGINFIDTAEDYKTEGIVGLAQQGRDRDSINISTKKSMGKNRIKPEEVAPALEASLRQMGTDYIDVYHLHGVAADVYDYALNEIVPVRQTMQRDGKIRYIGITESWNSDPRHDMLIQAVQDDVWDVMMVGFNVLNQTARDMVFAPAIEKNIGILIMFAVRLALSREEHLRETVRDLIQQGQLDPADIDTDNPLSFLLNEAPTIPDAAYRFCRDEPGTHVVLSGTGNPAHLQSNVETFDRPALSPAVIERLKHIFRNVDSATGQ